MAKQRQIGIPSRTRGRVALALLSGNLALTCGLTPAVAAPSPPPGFKIVGRRALPPGPFVGHPLPPLQLERLAGGTSSSAEWVGRPVVLNFWATWAEACKVDAQRLQAAQEKWGKDVLIVGVEIGRGQKEAIQRFVLQQKVTYSILVDPVAGSAQLFKIAAVPTTFFVDKDGTIRDIHVGALQPNDVEEGIKRILK